jgi:tetratricopeptide (TPR) repeat protein
MTHPVWRDWAVFFSAAVIATGVACHSEPAPVEELYTARMLGLSYLQRNQLSEAETQFTKLTKLAPDDPLGYADLGLTYLQAGRYDDAEKQLLRAQELDPASTEIGLALARLYSLTGRASEARSTLEKLQRDSTGNAHVLYALAELDSTQADSASTRRYEARLKDVLTVAPSNLAVRLKLIELFARLGVADSAVQQLEEVRRIPPEPPKEARASLDSSIQLLRSGNLPAARQTIGRFVELMQTTAPYQASLDEVRWTQGPIPGRPVLSYAPRSFISLHGVRERASVELAKFTDVTDDAGLGGAVASGASATLRSPTPATAIATGDVDGDGTDDLFVSTWSAAEGKSVARLYRIQNGFARDATAQSGISLPGGGTYATFADYDNDGWLDLFVIGGEGRGHLFRNNGNGTFVDVTAKAGVSDVRGARKAIFVDLDHDGDLDLLLVGGGQRTVYRNNLDGTFTEATTSFGLAGASDADDAAFADFDGDGRTDIFIANSQGSDALFHNGGAQHFADVTAASGLSSATGSAAVAVGDFNNDGFLDLFVGGSSDAALWINKGNGTFSRDTRSAGLLQTLRGTQVSAARFLDYDNDGWLDLVVGGTSAAGRNAPGVFLFRNDGTGKFLDRSSVIPSSMRNAGASALAISDVDDDGDQDLLVIDGSGHPRLLRNDLGNSNLAVNVELKGLRTGSGKNNAFGIGSRVELRAGDIYQTRVATGRLTHFGLGPHLKADVLRIEWTNGVPQTVYFPGSDQDVVESEMLKGSCALAYTWDGKHFRFVTDAMWRSALGMPLGLMGGGGAGAGTTAFAPAGASQEYLRIPGDALQPKDGRYLLQLTEELWETAYADQVKLIAVDHPDSTDVFVDERFVPPGPVSLHIFQISHRAPPLSATDNHGNNVLPALLETDDVYVSNLKPTGYQGVVEPHDLIMDLGPDAGRPDTYLFLRGWIYPTDASINVALGQQSTITPAPPSLEVRDVSGRWRVAIPSIGFPSGKNKTMIIDLAGKFSTADHHVRLRTNMQIYWDQAFVAHNLADSVKTTALPPLSADLHYRGFSRMYRKGGRYGPYWFAYDDVTKQSPWRTIEGAFTRFGDVLPLLRDPDDMYVVMGAGDEATIQFDASSATSLPQGWKRDFLLYTDGWIKDSDLNTASGTTVAPLPFHGERSYPYAAGEAYPTDSVHQRYLREYETRAVTRGVSPR